jgi:Fur family ferric uptake transcriptional regulator
VEHLGEDDWDRATLFRNLVKLVECNLARVASRVGGVTRYEAVTLGEHSHVHPHFACRDCRQVTCLHEAALRLPDDPIWRESLKRADLQLVGRCPSCRKGEA